MTKRMSQAEQRQIALRVAQSELRRMGVSIDPFTPFCTVLQMLDYLSRAEPELLALQWYAQASDHQIRLLRREWKKAVQPVYACTLWDCPILETNFDADKSSMKRGIENT